MIYFVHGFNETGDRWGDIARELDPDAVNFQYGWRFLLTIWFASTVAARTLASVARPGDIAVGYSNGCNVVNKACHYGAAFSQVVYFAPALDRDAALATRCGAHGLAAARRQIDEGVCPMRILVLLACLMMGGCAIFGNVGPMEFGCKSGDVLLEDGRILKGAEVQLSLPGGSGRVFPDGIDATESPCGVVIPRIEQGEDRSPGILGALMRLLGV